MQRVIRDASVSMGSMTALDAKIRLIQQYLPPYIASVYAIPREGSGNVMEWWTGLGGQAIPFASLSSEEQQRLLDLWQQRQQSIGHMANELQRAGNPAPADGLRSLIGEPEPQQLYSLNGELLVVRWASLRPQPFPAVAPPIAPLAATEIVSRRWWPWLLLGLLFLLLLCLWWWLWRTPQAVVPLAPATPAVPTETVPPAPEFVPEPVPQPELTPDSAPIPSEPEPKPAPVAVAKAKPGKVCPEPGPSELPPQFVVVLDTSGSMNLNIHTPRADDDWYGQVGALLDPQDPRVTRLMTKPSRLDVAKQSLERMINNIQPEIDTRFMAFQGCNSVVDYGLFPKSKRKNLIAGINGLTADQGTPLAQSLVQAAARVDGRNRDAVVVMFIDGEDNCQQDVCAVSRQIAQGQPRLKVNVVNIGENALSNCIAENTGGRVYVGQDAVKLRDMLRQASREVSKVTGCP
jgi:hypothetical protein